MGCVTRIHDLSMLLTCSSHLLHSRSATLPPEEAGRSWSPGAFWHSGEIQRQPSSSSVARVLRRKKKLKVFTDFHLFMSPSVLSFPPPFLQSLSDCHTNSSSLCICLFSDLRGKNYYLSPVSLAISCSLFMFS